VPGLSPHERWEVDAIRVMALIRLGRFAEASPALDSLDRTDDPKDAAHEYRRKQMRARLLLGLGRPSEALPVLLSAVNPGAPAQPGVVGIYRLLARIQAAAGRLDDAERTLRPFFTASPGCALPHYDLARLLDQRGRRDEAAAQYAEFLRLWSRADPGLPEAAIARERLHALRGGTSRTRA
jgi:hypothetical protein